MAEAEAAAAAKGGWHKLPPEQRIADLLDRIERAVGHEIETSKKLFVGELGTVEGEIKLKLDRESWAESGPWAIREVADALTGDAELREELSRSPDLWTDEGLEAKAEAKRPSDYVYGAAAWMAPTSIDRIAGHLADFQKMFQSFGEKLGEEQQIDTVMFRFISADVRPSRPGEADE